MGFEMLNRMDFPVKNASGQRSMRNRTYKESVEVKSKGEDIVYVKIMEISNDKGSGETEYMEFYKTDSGARVVFGSSGN
jgi:hypothetical protein